MSLDDLDEYDGLCACCVAQLEDMVGVGFTAFGTGASTGLISPD